MAKKKEKKQKELELEIRKNTLRAEIVRRKLLQALRSKTDERRPVAIMRRITDKIQPAFSEEHSMFGGHPKKQKPTFLY